MKQLLLLLLFSTSVNAQSVPVVPEGGLRHLYQTGCTDNDSGQKGDCVVSQDVEGTYYMTFWQQEQMQFIRKIVGDSYEVVYENPHFNSF